MRRFELAFHCVELSSTLMISDCRARTDGSLTSNFVSLSISHEFAPKAQREADQLSVQVKDLCDEVSVLFSDASSDTFSNNQQALCGHCLTLNQRIISLSEATNRAGISQWRRDAMREELSSAKKLIENREKGAKLQITNQVDILFSSYF
ncbi:unnamed protein product [Protopolystoma xenopodis]|uniref:Uncharacterized protein n=1 Tax=Protopolystoma xenopodis TaxID=117903 RepID=A0A448XQ11_9PLAT|nr:unnamed protein product [Protopolystoma xenopodis]